LGTQLVHLRVDFFKPGNDRLGRSLLQRRVKRGVDAKAVRVQVIFAVLAYELFADQVDKVRSVTGFNVLRSQLERRGFCRVSLGAGDGSSLNHGFQNQVAAVERALRMPVRRKIAGSLDQTGQKSSLREGKLFEVLAKVSLRRFPETGDGERTALAHVNLV